MSLRRDMKFIKIYITMTKQEEIDEDDEKLLEAFLSKDARPQRTLADLIVDKIKEKDSQVSSGFFLCSIIYHALYSGAFTVASLFF